MTHWWCACLSSGCRRSLADHFRLDEICPGHSPLLFGKEMLHFSFLFYNINHSPSQVNLLSKCNAETVGSYNDNSFLQKRPFFFAGLSMSMDCAYTGPQLLGQEDQVFYGWVMQTVVSQRMDQT